jgi:hypothetical protein
VSLDVDLEREQDIEELRRIAQALKAQNALLLEALTKKSRETSCVNLFRFTRPPGRRGEG